MYKVLIVDDEPIICKGLAQIIPWEEYNFEVADFAYNGKEAFEKVKRSNFDLIITDIRMPAMDGLELCKQLSENYPPVKIVVISGYSDFEYARKAIEYDVKAYLLKPIIPEELITRLLNIKQQLDHISSLKREDSDKDKTKHTKSLIENVVEYVDANYCEDISLSSIAETFYANSAYLGQLFKDTKGVSFSQYINRKRISRAKDLYLRGEYKIYEIIDKVGFKHSEYFYRQFKRYEGVTFAEFRDRSEQR